MSTKLVDSMHELLSQANDNWPRQAWTTAEGHVGVLERRLARATGSKEVAFCTATVNEGEAGVTRFGATLFTENLVISGRLDAPNERMTSSRIIADVVMVPRTAIRSLTLHQVDYFDNDRVEAGGHVSFTATYNGMDPVIVGPPSSYTRLDALGRLFDALQEDLVRAE